MIVLSITIHYRQQNKCYPQKCLIAHFEGTLDFSLANLLAHNNKSQICYCGQISLQRLQLTAVFQPICHL